MPELPEIETICLDLQKKIINTTITKTIVRQKSLRWPINPKLPKILINYKILAIKRRAKYLLISCYNKKLNKHGTLIIHLGMSGKLIITEQVNTFKKHDHVDFILDNNIILRYNDPRRFGAILWTNKDPLTHKLLINLGAEPLDLRVNANYLLNKALNKNLSIKKFIMHNKIIVGIGNIYANEALFAAKIHPNTMAKKLDLNQMNKLLMAIRNILNIAIQQGGTTLKDFFSPNGQTGKFVNELKVYGKNKQACLECNTIINQLILGQRSTFYCPKCQI